MKSFKIIINNKWAKDRFNWSESEDFMFPAVAAKSIYNPSSFCLAKWGA
jgi:hypothetical protein